MRIGISTLCDPGVAAAYAYASLVAFSEESSLSASENQLQKEGPGQNNK